MLYIFAGFPKTGLSGQSLNAGGLRVATEAEGIGLLEESPNVQYRKEGVFTVHGKRLSALLFAQSPIPNPA